MKIKKILIFCFPLVLAIIYTVFIAILSFDVFDVNASLLEKIGGFVMHNIPTIILLIALFFVWKNILISGAMFLSIFILFTIFFKTYQRWDAFVLISVPLLIIGGLFLLNKKDENTNSI
ncbi:MAG: hypothetical protein WC319_03420 [Candidatus Paceibacterota bacterium]|jgi:hypothetical protein